MIQPGDPAGERAAPFFCPYCGEESLRPLDAEPGRWRCSDCRRAFTLRTIAG